MINLAPRKYGVNDIKLFCLNKLERFALGGATTLSITIFSIMTLSITMYSIMTLSITMFSITTLSITTFIITTLT
jgi:hypothetical protein